MSAPEVRARRTRTALIVTLVLHAVGWGLATLLVLLIVIAALDIAVALPLALRQILRVTVLLVATAVTGFVSWRARAVLSLERVALWVEEQVPALRYAFVTATDPRHASMRSLLEPIVSAETWAAVVTRRASRAIAVPALIVLAALALLGVLPDGAVARVRAPRTGDALDRVRRAADPSAGSLSPLVALVTPPAYTRERQRTLEEPSTIAAPVGSRIVLQGRKPSDRGAGPRRDTLAADRVTARVDQRSHQVAVAGDRWSLSLVMPETPAAISLAHGGATRLVVLEPRPDSAPVVVLTGPQRDTVYAVPSGRIELTAEARDDYGIARAAFEYIVTSGEGERFTFRQGTLGARPGDGERRIELVASIALDSLELGAGDVVHLRAVARDANAVTGAGTGVSETRAIRIARRGEHDSLAIEGAPPPEPDRAALSQRMLILLTEALEARRSRLARETVVAESRTLARDQARLRRLVGEIIFSRLGDEVSGEHAHGPGDGHVHTDEEIDRLFAPESLLAAADRATGARAQDEPLDFAHGESPVVAINRPLLEAYNHMWDAGRELEVGEPGRALPPMRRALDALQEARAAERYFMRGRPPTVVVDIDRVRLARREEVRPTDRSPGDPDQRIAERYGARYARAVEMLREGPAAIDSLLLLRMDALEDAPDLSRALGEAIEALRTGRDATPALLQARRAIEGIETRASPLGRWSGPW